MLEHYEGVLMETARKQKFYAVLCLTVFALLLLMGCREPGALTQANPSNTRETRNLHPLSIQVFPEHAVVSVKETQGNLTVVLEQRGPRATFNLPEGRYSYEVSAAGFPSYQGSFEVPHNRNLLVDLSGL